MFNLSQIRMDLVFECRPMSTNVIIIFAICDNFSSNMRSGIRLRSFTTLLYFSCVLPAHWRCPSACWKLNTFDSAQTAKHVQCVQVFDTMLWPGAIRRFAGRSCRHGRRTSGGLGNSQEDKEEPWVTMRAQQIGVTQSWAEWTKLCAYSCKFVDTFKSRKIKTSWKYLNYGKI